MKINNTFDLFPNIFPDYLSNNHHQTATRSFILRSLSLFSLLCQVTSNVSICKDDAIVDLSNECAR